MTASVRVGEKKDLIKVRELIIELAIYEKYPGAVKVTIEQLEEDGFGYNKVFDFFVAELNNKIVGFALYYTSYSTWRGRCLYLEDLVVTEKHRKSGIGSLLFEACIEETKARKADRMEWQVLDWNKPAINFYKKYNANLDENWTNGKLFFTY